MQGWPTTRWLVGAAGDGPAVPDHRPALAAPPVSPWPLDLSPRVHLTDRHLLVRRTRAQPDAPGWVLVDLGRLHGVALTPGGVVGWGRSGVVHVGPQGLRTGPDHPGPLPARVGTTPCHASPDGAAVAWQDMGWLYRRRRDRAARALGPAGRGDRLQVGPGGAVLRGDADAWIAAAADAGPLLALPCPLDASRPVLLADGGRTLAGHGLDGDAIVLRLDGGRARVAHRSDPPEPTAPHAPEVAPSPWRRLGLPWATRERSPTLVVDDLSGLAVALPLTPP